MFEAQSTLKNYYWTIMSKGSKGNLLPPFPAPFKKFIVQTTCVQRTIALLHSPGATCTNPKKNMQNWWLT